MILNYKFQTRWLHINLYVIQKRKPICLNNIALFQMHIHSLFQKT
uniref:Uncharacterized protein n=1 Tax=Rhizophora mucronata TaxID=61149 RepID=A0A2P2NWQ4_RHIMU